MYDMIWYDLRWFTYSMLDVLQALHIQKVMQVYPLTSVFIDHNMNYIAARVWMLTFPNMLWMPKLTYLVQVYK